MVSLTLLIVAKSVARGLQETTVAWDPISCWDCPSAMDFVGPVVWGYLIGAVVGFSGVLRRRYGMLQPDKLHILNLE